MFYVLPVPWMIFLRSPGLPEHYKWAFPTGELWLASVHLTGKRTRKKVPGSRWLHARLHPLGAMGPPVSQNGWMPLCMQLSLPGWCHRPQTPLHHFPLSVFVLSSARQPCSEQFCGILVETGKEANLFLFLVQTKAHLLQTYLIIPPTSVHTQQMLCSDLKENVAQRV